MNSRQTAPGFADSHLLVGRFGARSRRRGFTLLEVIIATTIFAITAAALFVTFRTGIRAWRIGHNSSETFQTARITQDLLTRDLHNLAYLQEEEYNRSFRRQVDQLAAQLEGEDEEETAADDATTDSAQETFDPFLNINTITAPADLSFYGVDGGELDTLEFTRFQRPRVTQAADVNGLRRVRYFVEDGVLYREESSISGFRPGNEMADSFLTQPEKESVLRSFIGPGAAPDAAGEGSDATMNVRLSEPGVAEPLCEGVELFDLSFGYYRFGQWNEAPDWDSNAYRYRFPEDELETMREEMIAARTAETSPAGSLQAETEYNASGLAGGIPRSMIAVVGGDRQRFQIHPDNLPGYVAIQLGVRDEEGGRLRSFTFVISLAKAREEFDVTQIDRPNRPGLAEPADAPRPEPAKNLFVQ